MVPPVAVAVAVVPRDDTNDADGVPSKLNRVETARGGGLLVAVVELARSGGGSWLLLFLMVKLL